MKVFLKKTSLSRVALFAALNTFSLFSHSSVAMEEEAGRSARTPRGAFASSQSRKFDLAAVMREFDEDNAFLDSHLRGFEDSPPPLAEVHAAFKKLEEALVTAKAGFSERGFSPLPLREEEDRRVPAEPAPVLAETAQAAIAREEDVSSTIIATPASLSSRQSLETIADIEELRGHAASLLAQEKYQEAAALYERMFSHPYSTFADKRQLIDIYYEKLKDNTRGRYWLDLLLADPKWQESLESNSQANIWDFFDLMEYHFMNGHSEEGRRILARVEAHPALTTDVKNSIFYSFLWKKQYEELVRWLEKLTHTHLSLEDKKEIRDQLRLEADLTEESELKQKLYQKAIEWAEMVALDPEAALEDKQEAQRIHLKAGDTAGALRWAAETGISLEDIEMFSFSAPRPAEPPRESEVTAFPAPEGIGAKRVLLERYFESKDYASAAQLAEQLAQDPEATIEDKENAAIAHIRAEHFHEASKWEELIDADSSLSDQDKYAYRKKFIDEKLGLAESLYAEEGLKDALEWFERRAQAADATLYDKRNVVEAYHYHIQLPSVYRWPGIDTILPNWRSEYPKESPEWHLQRNFLEELIKWEELAARDPHATIRDKGSAGYTHQKAENFTQASYWFEQAALEPAATLESALEAKDRALGCALMGGASVEEAERHFARLEGDLTTEMKRQRARQSSLGGDRAAVGARYYEMFIEMPEATDEDKIELGVAYSDIGRYADAIKWLEPRTSSLDPYYNTKLAFSYIKVGQVAKGTEILEEIAKSPSASYHNKIRVAKTYLKAGMLDEAERLYIQAALDPEALKQYQSVSYRNYYDVFDRARTASLQEALYKLGLKHRDLFKGTETAADAQNAMLFFREVISLNDRHVKALHNLAMLHLHLENRKEAEGWFKKAAALGFEPSQNNLETMRHQDIAAGRGLAAEYPNQTHIKITLESGLVVERPIGGTWSIAGTFPRGALLINEKMSDQELIETLHAFSPVKKVEKVYD